MRRKADRAPSRLKRAPSTLNEEGNTEPKCRVAQTLSAPLPRSSSRIHCAGDHQNGFGKASGPWGCGARQSVWRVFFSLRQLLCDDKVDQKPWLGLFSSCVVSPLCWCLGSPAQQDKMSRRMSYAPLRSMAEVQTHPDALGMSTAELPLKTQPPA